MDTSKIIKGVVNSGRYTVTAPIVKEDYGLYLQIEGVELPQTYEVDFSNSENSGTSVTMIGNADGVLIPSQFIRSGKDVFAFLYHVGEDFGRTVYKFRIPNKVRPDRTEDTPTPEEQSVIDQAISALNSAVAQTAQDVIDADASAQNASADAERAEEARTDTQNYATQAEQSAADAHESASQASASATASAQSASQSAQIKSDVEDLVDDAQGYAESASQSASASAQSASDAQGYAQSASASAQSASTSASDALTYANTASSKATEASTSAQTASTKATEASQSAENALSYKTDAESAKTASQTAQGLAESARDTAVSAKTDAESARDDAEAARDEAQQAVASIADALDDKAPVITDTASGAIASFTDGADDLPLKSLVVDINPVQDLSHGDPSPENICPISGWTEVDVEQRGKNLFDSNFSDYTKPYNYYICPIKLETGKRYKLKAELVGTTITGATLGLVKSGNRYEEFVGPYYVVGSNGDARDFNITVDDTFTAPKLVAYVSGENQFNEVLSNYNVMLMPYEQTEYEPYTGRSITIDLGQTVYGGKLDVLTGELVIDRAMVEFDGSSDEVWYTYVSFGGFNFRTLDMPIGTRQSGKANWLKVVQNGTSSKTIWLGVDNSCVYVLGVSDLLPEYTVDAWKAYLAEHPLTVVYPLATPIEIQLDSHTLNSLYGVNNIWADSGDAEIEYRADTKLWVQKKIAEAISALS